MTQFLDANDPQSIRKTADFLQQGHLVIIPTDTVYGIGADAFNAAAIERLYMAKQRPSIKAIPILLANMADIWRVTTTIPALAQNYMQQFWPGPLTLIVPKHPDLPANISRNEGIAVRIPDCAVARAVIRAAGGAVATSSANLSGQPSARTAQRAGEQLGDWVSAVLNNGPSPGGMASTIIDCTGNSPRLVRPGPIQLEQQALTAL